MKACGAEGVDDGRAEEGAVEVVSLRHLAQLLYNGSYRNIMVWLTRRLRQIACAGRVSLSSMRIAKREAAVKARKSGA